MSGGQTARLPMLLSLLLALGWGCTPAGADEAADLARLERGEVIVTGDVDEYAGTGKGVAVCLIDAPPDRVFRTVTDYPGHPEFMPYVEACRVLRHEDDGVVVWSRSRVLLMAFDFTRKLKEDRAAGRVTWTQVDGDFRINQGSWTLEPHGDGQTRVTYRLEIAPRMRVPKFIIRRIAKSGLKDLLLAVRERVKDPRYDEREAK